MLVAQAKARTPFYIMRRHGNLFDKIIDIENIEKAFYSAAKGKRWQEVVREVESDLPNKLLAIREMLANHTFTTSRYRVKKIYEPKEREIFILPFWPDRIVQHAIMNIVEPIWQPLFITDSYACIKGRGQHAGSRRLMGMITHNTYCLKCDIRKFYPSINHDILHSIIEHKIKCKDTLWLFRDIINSLPGDCNVPIGNYTSQWMGNLYMNEYDQFVKHTLKVKDYIRYCDDFTLLSNDKAQLNDWRNASAEFLTDKLKLTLKIAEVFPTRHGIDFLGYRHFPGGYILLRKSTAKRVMRRIKNLIVNYENGKTTAEHVECSLASTDGWLKWANTYNLRCAIDINSLIRRFRYERKYGRNTAVQ